MIRVLVIDDSATVRRALSEGLGSHRDIDVVGVAPDPYIARERIAQLRPDVITLDLEMPRMDGLSFLAKLMRHHPMPVVVVSSLTPAGSKEAMRAYELGAAEVICKPGPGLDVDETIAALVRGIRAAAGARNLGRIAAAQPATVETAVIPPSDAIIAIGASTGGTEALRFLMPRLPADAPPTVIVQHMPPLFTAAFAQRLDGESRMRVAEAKGGEELRPGHAYLAPGGRHLAVERRGGRRVLALRDGPAVHFQRPAVDVLFHSVARAAGAQAMGVLLTGMGSDGADGLAAMRAHGAWTLAQDEATSVVFGMPRAAIELGAATEVAGLPDIPARIVRAARRLAATKTSAEEPCAS